MATERISLRLPDGFDPLRHGRALPGLIAKTYGEGFEVEFIDIASGTASATRQVAITEVRATGSSDSFEVGVRAGTKPADGEKVATKLADAHPGFEMTRFEPFLGKAILTRLSEDVARCRNAVAVSLSVKPWDVQVTQRKDGGFDLELPKSYVPSKHDDKLTEVATAIVGRDGWYVQTNPAKLTASIVPSDPPTFPGVIAYPFNSLKNAERDRVMLGLELGAAGEPTGKPLMLDFEAAPHTQISGTSGSGKSVALNTLVTGVLAGGSELVIIDLPHKSVDFFWCKDFVRDGGWGCVSLQASVAALGMVYAEGERRATVLAKHGATKWTELPAGAEHFAPIFVLVDEVTGLIQPDDTPKGVPKDHPMVQEINENNLLRATLLSHMKKIAAELRFVGIRLVLSSQVSSVNTGIPTALRMNLANKFLLGANPTDNNRKLALSDPTSVPKVPDNVRQDSKASRGVGVAELEALTPTVFKSFYASTDDLRKALEQLGMRKSGRPEPTPTEIARFTPSLDDGKDEGRMNYQDDYAGSNRGGGSGRSGGERAPSGKLASTLRKEMGDEQEWAIDPETGKRLTGNALANATRHVSASTAKASDAAKAEQALPMDDFA